MLHRSPYLPSFMLQVIMMLSRSTKPRRSYITLLPRMGKIRAPRWPWDTDTGAALVYWKIVEELWNGTSRLLSTVISRICVILPTYSLILTAMAKFLSGPPGGRTLPLTPTRLSDLDGGVYGPGASVASTGLNGQRPAIRASRARAAGETWEDILEYYIVGTTYSIVFFAVLISS